MLWAHPVPCWQYGRWLWRYSNICTPTQYTNCCCKVAKSACMPKKQINKRQWSLWYAWSPKNLTMPSSIHSYLTSTARLKMLQQWQGLHFHQSLGNLLRHSHICSELSKCVITSLWELCYHDRERERERVYNVLLGGDLWKLTLCCNSNKRKLIWDIHLIMCGTGRSSEQAWRVWQGDVWLIRTTGCGHSSHSFGTS